MIEAVTENEKLKTNLYKQLAGVLEGRHPGQQHVDHFHHPHVRVGAGIRRRRHALFLPVDASALVEVIRGKKTSDETVTTIVQLAKKIHKKRPSW